MLDLNEHCDLSEVWSWGIAGTERKTGVRSDFLGSLGVWDSGFGMRMVRRMVGNFVADNFNINFTMSTKGDNKAAG